MVKCWWELSSWLNDDLLLSVSSYTSSYSSPYKATNPIRLGPQFMTSLNLNYFIKVLAPNTITLWARVSIYTLGRDTNTQSIISSKKCGHMDWALQNETQETHSQRWMVQPRIHHKFQLPDSAPSNSACQVRSHWHPPPNPTFSPTKEFPCLKIE